MAIKGSHLIARALKAEGVNTIFALAGDHTLTLMDVMAADGFRFLDTRHEQAAVDMANAWGRITGSPGVTMFTTPGHANAIPGLALASHTEAPLVNISGCASQDRLGQGAMQEIDQVGMATPVTKGAWLVTDPYRIPEFFARAFRTALSGRRGPVHLTIPIDVQEAEIDEGQVRFYHPAEYRPTGPVLGNPNRVKDAIELLHQAKRPVMVAGNGAFSATREDLERFVEVTRLPLFTEEAARGLVSDAHPYCFGFADSRVSDTPTCLKDADVVLLLGKKLDFTVSFGEPPTFSPDVRFIQVEPAIEQIGLARGVDVAILGDVGAIVVQLAKEADGYDWKEDPRLRDLESIQRSQERRLEALAVNSGPLHAMSVHRTLRPLLENDDCLIFEGSDFAFFGAAYHTSPTPKRWFCNSTLGMIGFGVPFSLGAQVALPQSKVVLLTGDGAFGFNAMEMDTAVRHGLPVVIIVGNDRVWGMDYHQQIQLYKRKVATELLPTRYDKVAEALGAHGEYVDDQSQLLDALKRALASDRPSLVNVQTMPAPSPLTEWAIKMKSAQAGGT